MLSRPNIWMFSAAITAINLITLTTCVWAGNATGTWVNAFFLVFNAVSAICGFHLRHVRAILNAEAKEAKRMERRNQLIRLTIGE